jgi:hypothetical protein
MVIFLKHVLLAIFKYLQILICYGQIILLLLHCCWLVLPVYVCVCARDVTISHGVACKNYSCSYIVFNVDDDLERAQ